LNDDDDEDKRGIESDDDDECNVIVASRASQTGDDTG